MEMQSTS